MPDISGLQVLCTDAHSVAPKNCSGAVKHFAKSLGIYLPDRKANELIEYMQANWVVVTAAQAQDYADKGRFVVAGKKDATNGHVVVVLPGGMIDSGGYEYVKDGQTKTAANHGKFPRACSTALGSWPGAKSNGDKSVFDAWGNATSYSAVKYWLAPLCTKPAK